MAPSGAPEKNAPFVYPLAPSNLDVKNDTRSLQKGTYIFKNFRLRRANPVPKTTEGKRPVAVGFFSFPWTPVPTVNQNTSALAGGGS